MVQHCSIDDVRKSLKKIKLDDQIRALSDYYVHRMKDLLRELRVSGRVVNTGSTHESRMTYVLDPFGKHKPFPPDIDLNIIVNELELPKNLERTLADELKKGGHVHKDMKHEKMIIIRREGDVNVSIASYTKKVAEGNNEVDYIDRIEPFSDEQRIEARTLKLILQRHGCYAGYNRAIPGIAVDEIVRKYGRVEEC